MLHHHYHNAGALSTSRAIWRCNYTQKSQGGRSHGASSTTRCTLFRSFLVEREILDIIGVRHLQHHRNPLTALITLSHEYIFSALNCLFKQRDTQSRTACQWCQYLLTVGIGFAVRYWTLTFICADLKKIACRDNAQRAELQLHFTIGCGLTELSFVIIL